MKSDILALNASNNDKFSTNEKIESYRVIHFPDWSIGNELFQSWIAHAFCSYIPTPVTRKAKLTRMTRPPFQKTCIN